MSGTAALAGSEGLSLSRFVKMIARERTLSRPDDFDDAYQEGMIAAWEASASRPDAPAVYLRAAAKNGVNGVLVGRKLTGAPSRQGRRDAGADAQAFPDDYDAPAAPGPSSDLAAHRGDILRALTGLSPMHMTYVAARYWADLTVADAAEVAGMTARTAETHWRTIIRPHLRDSLAHLATAA